MTEISNAFAKLAGVLKSAKALLLLEHNPGKNARPYHAFNLSDAEDYFESTSRLVAFLREKLPDLFGDFPEIHTTATTQMATQPTVNYYGRAQVEGLVRSIEQIFEIRSHSELATPVIANENRRRVFLTHGRANDWREVQAYVERTVEVATLELAQQPNLGRHVLLKLEQESSKCDSAVIVMTGDDVDDQGHPRARENVLHEIGYFQAKFGLDRVCLLHEEGTNIPSNIHGLVYIPFTRGNIGLAFGPLHRELKAFYRL